MKSLYEIKELGNFDLSMERIELLCALVADSPQNVYSLIALVGGEADTVTREAIFQYIADKYHNGNYDTVYTAWLQEVK